MNTKQMRVRTYQLTPGDKIVDIVGEVQGTVVTAPVHSFDWPTHCVYTFDIRRNNGDILTNHFAENEMHDIEKEM